MCVAEAVGCQRLLHQILKLLCIDRLPAVKKHKKHTDDMP
jgi:hypothetical protein